MPRQLQNLMSPVPSDIDIAQSTAPLKVAVIAKELGLLEDEFDLYGQYKAKVLVLFNIR